MASKVVQAIMENPDGNRLPERLKLNQVEQGAPPERKDNRMTKFAWIANVIKSFPSVLPSITKYPLAACALMMFVITLVNMLK